MSRGSPLMEYSSKIEPRLFLPALVKAFSWSIKAMLTSSSYSINVYLRCLFNFINFVLTLFCLIFLFPHIVFRVFIKADLRVFHSFSKLPIATDWLSFNIIISWLMFVVMLISCNFFQIYNSVLLVFLLFYPSHWFSCYDR